MSAYDWMADALCAQTDPDLWHPGNGSGYGTAARICADCPVREACNAHAGRLQDDSGHLMRGMWAGQHIHRRGHTPAALQSVERRETILRLIDRGGMTAEEIAEHVGCHPRTVWRAIKEQRQEAAS
ncbi:MULTISPECIES: WhiB family transcriptional regulator [unclassified Streptomyces]|uniref:WhiB family transcriptional regulator n=1 Tax=unclassified Streptomyces TaxID=2593676 RepID=UPI000DDA9F45|nr:MULTISPECIES: WhiB family transcriptional regulator [unclassified Streptomyces]QZZ26573.1 helix-turn-helix domain-containing protein [Streptomyces sp. ST1015]